jgi:hypothetical protein
MASKWGFYSQKHANKIGQYSIYKTPTGDEVKVTAVYATMDDYSATGAYPYSDAIAVGKVTTCVEVINVPIVNASIIEDLAVTNYADVYPLLY